MVLCGFGIAYSRCAIWPRFLVSSDWLSTLDLFAPTGNVKLDHQIWFVPANKCSVGLAQLCVSVRRAGAAVTAGNLSAVGGADSSGTDGRRPSGR